MGGWGLGCEDKELKALRLRVPPRESFEIELKFILEVFIEIRFNQRETLKV